MSLIGLDIGTTGCKCTLFDTEGKTLAFSYKEYFIQSARPGWYELNPAEVWDAVKYVLYEAVKGYAGEPSIALAVSSIGEAATPVNEKGNILYNSILYHDYRGTEQAAFFERALGVERIMELTGIPVNPMYTINKILWLKENQPETYDNAWKFLLFEDFIIYKLTGIAAVDYSLASRTMAFNIVEKKWEPGIFEAAGVEADIFSQAVPSGTIVGNIKKELAFELGLPRQLIVVTGGHDQACAALGAGIVSQNRAVDGMGTADCITTAFDKPVLSKRMLKNNFNCEPHIIKDMYITLSFTVSGGSLLKWYRDWFGLDERQDAQRKNTSVYAILDEKAAAEPSDILVLPHFSGSGTPRLDPLSKGAMVGLTLETTRYQIYRALMEGVAYEMRYNLECLESAGIMVDSLRAAGGGAKSDLWLQIKADITGKPIDRLDTVEAGTLAAAVIAGTAAGIYPSVMDAVSKFVKPREKFIPDPWAHEIYEKKYRRYKGLYKAVKSVL